MVRFADWAEARPDGWVLKRPTHRDYRRDRFAGYAHRVDAGQTPFPVSSEALEDDRLSSGTTVVTAQVGSLTVAWPVSPARTVEDTVDGHHVRVVTDGVGGSVEVDGDPVATRVSMWFAVVAAFPDVIVGA